VSNCSSEQNVIDAQQNSDEDDDCVVSERERERNGKNNVFEGKQAITILMQFD
jgi:hypothetical protein